MYIYRYMCTWRIKNSKIVVVVQSKRSNNSQLLICLNKYEAWPICPGISLLYILR